MMRFLALPRERCCTSSHWHVQQCPQASVHACALFLLTHFTTQYRTLVARVQQSCPRRPFPAASLTASRCARTIPFFHRLILPPLTSSVFRPIHPQSSSSSLSWNVTSPDGSVLTFCTGTCCSVPAAHARNEAHALRALQCCLNAREALGAGPERPVVVTDAGM